MSRSLISALILLILVPVTPAFAKVIDRLEASVNSSLILLSDVKKFRKSVKLRQQTDPLFRSSSLATSGDNPADQDIVEFLIDEKIILQKYPVTDAEVEQQINEIQSRNRLDRAQLRAAIESEGFTFEEYFEVTRAGWSKQSLIRGDIQSKVSVSDDDVKNFFYNHYNKGSGIPLSYRIQIISVSTSNFKTTQAAREVAERARQALKAGEPWAEVSKRFSDHPSAATGGDLGVMTEDQIAPSIRDQVKKLQIGEISGVLGGPTSGGFYVLKLADMNTSDNSRLEKMRDEIREQLLAKEYQHQIQLWLERQRQSAFIHKAGDASTAGIPKVNETKK